MNLDKIIFGLVVAMLVVLCAAMLSGGATSVGAVPHPDYPSMLHGGDGSQRNGPVLWHGLVFGILLTTLFGVLMAFGARKGGSFRGLALPLGLSIAVHIAVFTWLVLAYRSYLAGDDGGIFLAFPAPSALLIYGIWPLLGLFTLCFVVGFKRWILTDDDYAEYERLLAEKTSRKTHQTRAEDTNAPGGPAARDA
ncbi:MAG: hypothetical protein O7F16_05785 [Acidobacteria bacterium]|nr:hypothetical protein [Acidobacteriota bacterium]